MSKAKKLKKPLDLPLGKATSQKDVDLSHVRLPIETSVFGLKHVLTLFETATNEVKSFLAYECDLMYECRVCRTIFRSIANFILHKRKFCKDKYNAHKDPQQQNQDMGGVAIIQRDIETANQIIAETEAPSSSSSSNGSSLYTVSNGPSTRGSSVSEASNSDKISGSLNPIIETLLKRQKQQKLVEEIKNEKACQSSETEEVKKVDDLKSISLEKIEGSNVAVFQTMDFGPKSVHADLMKSQVMEIHSIFEQDEAVLDSNGKIISFDTNENNNENEYLCTECNMSFSTKKTLTYHVKYKHSESRLVYPCPRCKEQLSNPWSVYRHLQKVHRMTTNQMRRCRNQVHNSAICIKSEVSKAGSINTKEKKDGINDDDEWLDSVEKDRDLQMCGGCGKHFDRKAALISHAIMCSKRIAVCNSIKGNNSRKKGSALKENGEKYGTTWAMRSSRRKGTSVILYKKNTTPEEIPPLKNDTEKNKEASIVILPISGEKEHDIESTEKDRIRKDIQLDKNEVLSIIGLDTVGFNDRSTPSIDKNIDDQISNQNESPSRELETQVPEHAANTVNEDLKNLIKDTQDISTLIKTNSTDFENVVGDSSEMKTDPHIKNSDNKEIDSDQKNALSSHSKKKNTKKKKGLKKRRKVKNVIKNKEKNISDKTHASENDLEKTVGNECELIVESAVILPISGINKSDVENSEEYTREIQLMGKDEVFSIIGFDTIASSSTDKNIDSQLSDQNDSPCRGFQSIGIESADKTATGDLKYLMRETGDALSIKTYSSHSKNILANLNSEDEIQKPDESSACSSKSPPGNKMDISSDISLDNKIHCDFKLDLDEDPNFSDVSIKPLIKEIIEEDAETEITENNQENEIETKELSHKINGTNEDVKTKCEESVTFDFEHEKSDNNNSASDTGSCSSNMKKRRRSISPDRQEKMLKLSDPKQFEKKTNDNDYESFVSKIAPFIDIEKLICSLCNSQFLSSPKLMLHMSEHFSWFRYQCSQCLYMSFFKHKCKKHVMKCHKVPSNHAQGAVLPIPAWKASMISKQFTNKTLNKTENPIDSGQNLINNSSNALLDNSSTEIKIVIIDLENTNKASGHSEALVVEKEETISSYADLTIDNGDVRNDIEIANNCGSSEGRDTVQDLSKQAIMEVILGNTENKSNNVCSEPTEYLRPSRNRTKSIKTCQKDFIYDLDVPKATSHKGGNFRGDAENMKQSTVQE